MSDNNRSSPTNKRPKLNHDDDASKPLRIGVFGGSFNPIHLGHALLAITTLQSQPIDRVVLVPVYKHPWKTDLLPFEDRVAMCRLAVAASGAIQISTVEQAVGVSNGPMLEALKKQYHPDSKFFWICGDDFFGWMESEKGLETLRQVHGLIVQRRLHKKGEEEEGEAFYKEPVDEPRIRSFVARLDLSLHFIYGELPHFSSTLVRRAPGHWRSFLPQSVSAYLEERPHLLEQLLVNLENDSKREEQQKKQQEQSTQTTTNTNEDPALQEAAAWVMKGLDIIHTLQMERGGSGMRLSVGTPKSIQEMEAFQAKTDEMLKGILDHDMTILEKAEGLEEVLGLAKEIQMVPVWLQRDRTVLKRRGDSLVPLQGIEGWMARLALVEKFNPRIDVLSQSLFRALTEIRSRFLGKTTLDAMPELLWKWSKAKEALGRLRAFVCAGGPRAPWIISQSCEMRQRLNECIQEKDLRMERVLEQHQATAIPEALHRMLEDVTGWEWTLMRCFASSTPLSLAHKLLSKDLQSREFDVQLFFGASTTAINYLLAFTKAMVASACAGG